MYFSINTQCVYSLLSFPLPEGADISLKKVAVTYFFEYNILIIWFGTAQSGSSFSYFSKVVYGDRYIYLHIVAVFFKYVPGHIKTRRLKNLHKFKVCLLSVTILFWYQNNTLCTAWVCHRKLIDRWIVMWIRVPTVFRSCKGIFAAYIHMFRDITPNRGTKASVISFSPSLTTPMKGCYSRKRIFMGS